VKEFLEYTARALVDEPDRVEVSVAERAEELELTLTVEERDMGKVIGRDGRIAKALRNLLRVMAARDGRHVELEIRSHE